GIRRCPIPFRRLSRIFRHAGAIQVIPRYGLLRQRISRLSRRQHALGGRLLLPGLVRPYRLLIQILRRLGSWAAGYRVGKRIEIVLSFCIALWRRPPEPASCFIEIFGNSPAVQVGNPEVVLCSCKTLCSALPPQIHCFPKILLHSVSLGVMLSEHQLRRSVSGAGGTAQQLHRAALVLLETHVTSVEGYGHTVVRLRLSLA